MPIAFVMSLVGVAGVMLLRDGDVATGIMKTVPYSAVASYNMSVVPLFILMGEFAFQSGLTHGLYDAVYKWMGHRSGGLALATISACGLFAAISGSSPATAGAMGRVALPEMERYKYDLKLATASIAAGGTLGILIPPSVPMVIYGILTEQPIGKLLIAGIVPGLLLMFFYMLTVVILVKRNPALASPGPRFSYAERFAATRRIAGILIIFLITIGGIWTGLFTATEGAAVGAFLTFLYALGSRQLTWPKFLHVLLETGRITAMLFGIFIGAMIFGYFLSMAHLPQNLAAFLSALPVSPHVIMFGIWFIYLILGCVMDSLAMILLTIPIFFPVVMKLGYDPIWFGVMVVSAVELGLITPPVGMNLYVVKGIAPHVKLGTIYRGVMPFVWAVVIFELLLYIFPQIVLMPVAGMK
jgi:tripartite ATP-independent transporter DctM subunit